MGKKGKKISIGNKCWNAQHEVQCMHFVCFSFSPFPSVHLYREHMIWYKNVFFNMYAGMQYALWAHRANVVCELLSTPVKRIFS